MNKLRLQKLPKGISNTYNKLVKYKIPSKLVFVTISIMATVWFLIRVIPKPSRAAYPCMQVAVPFMSSLVIWLGTVTGSIIAFKNAKKRFLSAKYLGALGLFLVGVIFLITSSISNSEKANAQTIIEPWYKANNPIGIAKGIHPGRVAWTHAPGTAIWDGVSGYWWEDKNINQSYVDNLLEASLKLLTDEKSERKAWNALFKHFNKVKHGKSNKYIQGEKIAIKINQNNAQGHKNVGAINGTPQLILTILKSLIEEAGVPQSAITVFDASRFIGDNIYNKCNAIYPNVIFVDHSGGDGRKKAQYVQNVIPYSVDNGALAQGLAKCIVDANYVINMAQLKGHPGQGVTLSAKNYYGATNIYSDWKKNSHSNFAQNRKGKAKYMTFVDFLGHKNLGNKTMLFMLDAIYAHRKHGGIPKYKWQMEPFNNNWPSSLFLSQDPVALDAVGMDFILNEWPDAPDLKYCDSYLIEAAQADNPPSGTKYDPEQDGTTLESLGVLEHWNNAVDKQYSRNLNKINGTGIELLYKNTLENNATNN